MKKLWLHYPKQESEVFIDECGIEEFFAGQTYSYTVLTNFILHYVESGSGYLNIRGKMYRIESGEGFLLRKGDQVKYTADRENPWCNYWVGLDGKLFNTEIKNTTLKYSQPLKFHRHLLSDAIREFCLCEMRHEKSLENDYYWYMSQAYALLYLILQDFPKNRLDVDIDTDKDNSYATYALEIMKKYYDTITISEIADVIGISRSYLYKEFTKKYDKSPKQMLNIIRLEAASEMLSNLDLSISEIGLRIGFNNVSDFSKSFKLYLGSSPTRYRKNIRGDSETFSQTDETNTQK